MVKKYGWCLALGVLSLASCRTATDEPDPACVANEICNPECERGEDPDCAVDGCLADGRCNAQCGTWDPDCVTEPCGADLLCNPRCAEDPDCASGPCGSDGECDEDCGIADPDCAALWCEYDGECDDRCAVEEGLDPDCDALVCAVDGVCNPRCPAGSDPDCAALGCEPDGICNPDCDVDDDPDCDDDCVADLVCNEDCPEGADPDCDEGCGGHLQPCCEDGGWEACQPELSCVEVGATDLCMQACESRTCGTLGSCVSSSSGMDLGICVDFGGGLDPCSVAEGFCPGSSDGEGWCESFSPDSETGFCFDFCDQPGGPCPEGTWCLDGDLLGWSGGACIPPAMLAGILD